MQNSKHSSLSKRLIIWFIITYFVSAIAIAPSINWENSQKSSFYAWMTFGGLFPATQALVWPTYVWERISAPPFEDPLHTKSAAELKKFNLIWYYLANANNALANRMIQYNTTSSFLADCHNFDDYISALHQMLYASHAIDTHMLNSIYPELGTRFQTSWIKGANLMLNACISGSEDKYLRSKAASDEWFSWYGTNSQSIENALKKTLL